MQHVSIPAIGAANAWRVAARGFLASGTPPGQIVWGDATTAPDLFATAAAAPGKGVSTVPRSFVAMANSVVWHNDPERFARLYAFLWRLKDVPHLMTDRGDADLAHLRRMEKNVHRCQHKMKAFVRFREISAPQDERRSFVAWFEPTHHTVEPTASFFARRFADMDWRILTPDVSVTFIDGDLAFTPGQSKPDLPEDAGEQLWITYFRNIFNPARLKVRAMHSEMPKKYWKNMPEAAIIPELIANAPARAQRMADAAPSLPPPRMTQIKAQLGRCQSAWDGPSGALPAAIGACTRCPLHHSATQAVPGEGPLDADLMIVGEQPGDMEDLTGKPFVGPAGQLLNEIASRVGLDRGQTYVTNAVKHFKFKPKGKVRLHQRPNTSEIEHCRWWLDAELQLVKPKLVIAMGATAAEALTGTGMNILRRRGKIEETSLGQPVLITVHPSFLLRQREESSRKKAEDMFQQDLRDALSYVQSADLLKNI